MNSEHRSEIAPNELTQGPFIIRLGVRGADNGPHISGKWILGGMDDAEKMLAQALDDISNLPDGLSWDQLRQEANGIFRSKGLLRIDF